MRNWNTLVEEITNWISDYAHENDIRSLVVGVSGGVDSAVTSTLSARTGIRTCLLYTSPSPRDAHESRMPSSA